MAKRRFRRKYRRIRRHRGKSIARKFKRVNEGIVRARITCLDRLFQNTGAQVTLNNCYMLEMPGQAWYTGYGGAFPQYAAQDIVCTNLARYQALYDEYRVRRLTVSYYPVLSADAFDAGDQGGGVGTYSQLVDPAAQNKSCMRMYMLKDYDDNAGVVSEAVALNKTIPKHIYRPHSMTMMPQKSRLKTWLNTQVTSPSAIPVATNTITGQIPYKSSLKVFFPQIVNAIDIGYLRITWDVEFKGLRTA